MMVTNVIISPKHCQIPHHNSQGSTKPDLFAEMAGPQKGALVAGIQDSQISDSASSVI